MHRRPRPARLLTALVAAGTVATTAACGGSLGRIPVSPAEAVQSSYATYAEAVTAKNGQQSAGLMSAASVAYYDHIRDLALDASRATLAKQSLIDQLTVLTMRGTLNAALLRTASPHDLIEESVDDGLIGNGSLPVQGLEQVQVHGDRATAELVLEGSVSQYPVAFQRESGVWKFDVTSLLKPAESGMEQARAQQKMSARTLINQVLVTRFGKARAARLYRPLGRK
jgi:hypothetical protein